MAKLNTGPEWVDIDGMIVEKDCLRIAEAVKAYDENLEILCNTNCENLSEAPYVLVEHCKDGEYRRISEFWELNDDVLVTIEAADGQKHDLVAMINGKKERLKRDADRRYRDLREDIKDRVAHIAGMKSRYTVEDPRTGELLAFYDDRPPVRGAENIKGKIQL